MVTHGNFGSLLEIDLPALHSEMASARSHVQDSFFFENHRPFI